MLEGDAPSHDRDGQLPRNAAGIPQNEIIQSRDEVAQVPGAELDAAKGFMHEQREEVDGQRDRNEPVRSRQSAPDGPPNNHSSRQQKYGIGQIEGEAGVGGKEQQPVPKIGQPQDVEEIPRHIGQADLSLPRPGELGR